MQKLLFWGPVLTASGYGEHARQLLRAILAYGRDQFDVSVCGVKWGSTPFINDDDDFVKKIIELQNKYEEEKNNNVQYDVCIQVTIPNEFQKLAKINIGVTAGIEVDRVSPEWIKKANDNVDLVVVPSKHSAQTYANVTYRNDKGEELSLKKPVLVASEGVDSRFFNLERGPDDGAGVELEADFNFFSNGLGFDRGMGEDRKNLSTLVKYFCETFKDDKRVGLVLKTSLVNNSLMDFEAIQNRIRQIKHITGCGEYPRIHLVHGRMSRKQLASLYKHPKIKAFVTFTHGEGFGLPVIEAAACGLPVIATNWSGHLDFLHTPDGKKKFVPVEFDLVEIPASAVWNGVMEKGTRWANVKEEDAKLKLKKVMLSPEKPAEWARELAEFLHAEFDEQRLGFQFVSAISQFLKEVGGNAPERADQLGPVEVRKRLREQLQIPEGSKTLLYTMPMSAGDVFISSAVIDSLKKKFPEHMVVFAVDPKYGSILKDNPNIFRAIHFDNWMMNVPFCEKVFDEVYTPNLAVQMNTSNWVHGGKGRLLGNEIAAQCGVELGEYFIKQDPVDGLPEKFIAFHPGSGKGQHEARNYRHWKKVIHNIRKVLPEYQVVTVGEEGDIHFEGCVDLRGQTTYNQLATVIGRASCLVGIDSVSMHMAAAAGTPHVAIFGSSYSTSTGPVLKKLVYKDKSILIDTPNRMGCEKACYKYQCTVDKDSPCLNEIDPKKIVSSVKFLVTGHEELDAWDDVRPKIAGYTHVLNAETHGYPYVESIKSMLGFCDEVVVVDGGSTDATVEKIKAICDDRIKVYDHAWDWNEPGMDGMQKAYGRAMASIGPDDFLWQQDADEVVHERDYQKIRALVERFPTSVDVLHLPVVELWGSPDRVRTDRHSWKWRLSRNNFRVTHGINKNARVFDEKTGKTYAKKGMSDGCEYVDIMTGDHLPHKGFYTNEIESARRANPQAYGKMMNKIFGELPSVFHYSWANLPRKIRNFKQFWNKCWSNLYNDPSPVDRFPDVHTESDVVQKANELSALGGEHGKAETFTLEGSNPALMTGWFERVTNDSGHLRDDQEQARPAEEVASVTPGVHGQEPIQADDRP